MPEFPTPSGSPVYLVMMLVGISIGAVYWARQAKKDSRLPLVYFGGLVGLFLGAKLAFLFAEGWLYFDHPDRLLVWLSGKSITGGLLGGWAGVELTKRLVGYSAITGDRFATLIPIPLALGRIGCLHAGCCPGNQVCGFPWPAVQVEIAFQIIALATILVLRHRKRFPGQLFHLYLIAYGLFRFAHEFFRDTPKPFLGLSGYQIISLLIVALASASYVKRKKVP
ncbi:prolipoprotein diacylglyceryl transferase [Haloferula sp.]|uniref:prolipoprotein diacylglyceryl transferase n=1 Tax=Haloferula sp. TaxID=2497595 RepID=UPI00329EFC85